MLAQKIFGILLILAGLGFSIFAGKIFGFGAQSETSKKYMQFHKWPAWMVPTWLWMMRIFGAFLAVAGVIFLLTNTN
jgi:hypothetical protein